MLECLMLHRKLSIVLIAIVIVPTLVAATVPFTPSSAWRKPNITSSLADRVSTSNNAIQRVINSLANGKFASPDFYALVADFDSRTNQKVYEPLVTDYYKSVTLNPNEAFPNFVLIYGTSAVRAYAVYKIQSMLDLAIDVWTYGRKYTISGADATAGKTAVKAFDLLGTCEGATMAGGTFWKSDVNDSTIVGFSTGLFFILSSYLTNLTSNEVYLDAAKESGAFMLANLNITNEGNGKAAMSAKLGDSCTRDLFGPGSFRLDHAAMFIEGLAWLPPDTVLGTQNVESLRATMVNITLTTNTLCNGDNGVINVGGGKGHPDLVNALGALYQRDTGSADIRTYIHQYLGVQYNAVMDLARTTISGSDIYSGSWSGPPSAEFSADNHTSALAVLNAGILIYTPPPSSNSTGGGGTNGGDNKSSLVGAIAGGVIGGVVFILAIIFIFLFFRRRRQWRQKQAEEEDPMNVAIPAPFTATGPSSVTITAPNAAPMAFAGYHGKSSRQIPTRTWGAPESTVPPSSVSAPSASGSMSPPEDRENIPTEELLRLLQERIERERAPPAYHDTRS